MKKDDTLIVKINKEQKKEFIEYCKENDTSASREIRHFIKKFLSENTITSNK